MLVTVPVTVLRKVALTVTTALDPLGRVPMGHVTEVPVTVQVPSVVVAVTRA